MTDKQQILAELRGLFESRTEVTEHNPWSDRGQAWLVRVAAALEQVSSELAGQFRARSATIQVPLSSYTAGPIWNQMLLIIRGTIAKLEREIATQTSLRETFSRRTGIRAEYSGPTEITPTLRTRLRTVMLHYLAEGEIGIGQEDLWVPGEELHHRLRKTLGREITLREVLKTGDVADVLDTTEVYLQLAAEAASQNSDRIMAEVAEAFELSGSVFYVDASGRINMGLAPETAERIDRGTQALASLPSAKGRFEKAVSGLLTRDADPEDVVKDTFVALEEYLKQATEESDFDAAVKHLRQARKITTTQAQVLQRLQAYRSATHGTAHAGEEPTPTATDALWYLDTVSAQIALINRATKS